MIICVVGPTAVGKTRLSEELAKKYDAIIVNSDAMQIYRELNIGTAKIREEEKLVNKHYLFDIKNPDEDYSVYDYQKDARAIIDANRDKNIVFVGGTGLYLKAALFDYEFSTFQEKKDYADYTNSELYELLNSKGLIEGVHINNRRRLISRLNSGQNSNRKDELLYKDVHFIGLTTDRKMLYDRIDKRVDEMIDNGLIKEVEDLYHTYGKVKSLCTGIGYKELIEYLDGNISLDDAINLIKQRSRKYAKRQYTWFNHQMDIKWFDVDFDNFDNTIKNVKDYLG